MGFRNAGLPAVKFKQLFELSDKELAEGAVRRIADARSLARASCFDPTPCRNIAATYPESTQRRKISIFRRLFNVVYVSPERQTEQDILSLIGGPCGRLTDEVERRIERYLSRNSSFLI